MSVRYYSRNPPIKSLRAVWSQRRIAVATNAGPLSRTWER